MNQIMTEETIKFLQDQAKVQELTNKVKDTEEPVVVIPDGYKISSIEEYMASPSKFVGEYSTDSVDDFYKYATEKSGDASPVFIDTSKDTLSAKVIFDFGDETDPLHRRHKSLLTLSKLPAFTKVTEIYDSFNKQSRSECHKMGQLELADFLIDWSEDITIHDEDGNSMELAKATAFARNITIEQVNKVDSSVGDFKAEQTAAEKIELKSTEKKISKITFHLTPYLDFKSYSFDVRVQSSAARGESGVAFTLRPLQFERRVIEIEDDFVSMLREKLGSNFEVLRGSFS